MRLQGFGGATWAAQYCVLYLRSSGAEACSWNVFGACESHKLLMGNK